MTETEKAYLVRLSRAERTAFLKANRKPSIPPPRTYNARLSARKKTDRRECARIREQYSR